MDLGHKSESLEDKLPNVEVLLDHVVQNIRKTLSLFGVRLN